jgi:CRISPR-associated exonuclease Cas4
MLQISVEQVAVYHVASRQRQAYLLDTQTRARTIEIVEVIREMLRLREVPEPVADARCRRCSLFDACMPFAVRTAISGPHAGLFAPQKEAELP